MPGGGTEYGQQCQQDALDVHLLPVPDVGQQEWVAVAGSHQHGYKGALHQPVRAGRDQEGARVAPTIQGEGLRITEDMVEKSCQTDTQHLGASIEQDVPDAPSCECSGEDGDYGAKQTGEGGIG